MIKKGKPLGLVEDSRSEPWSLDVGLNPGVKTRWKDPSMAENITKILRQPNGASHIKKEKNL